MQNIYRKKNNFGLSWGYSYENFLLFFLINQITYVMPVPFFFFLTFRKVKMDTLIYMVTSSQNVIWLFFYMFSTR